MNNLVVYGTLLSGFGNWSYHLAPKVGKPVEVTGFIMYSLGGFPMCIPGNEDDVIVGELYGVTDDELRNIDRLEGYRGPDANNFYDRLTITLEDGRQAFIYAGHEPPGTTIVPNGDWRAFVKSRR